MKGKGCGIVSAVCNAPPAPQVCSALAQVAKHSVDLAEVVVEAEVFPKLLTCLKVPRLPVQLASACACRVARCADRR